MTYKLLSEGHKRTFAKNLVARRRAYSLLLQLGRVEPFKTTLIVGDRPGPKAPDDAEYHNTPFYSTKYSGGWLNEQLVLGGVNEKRLLWINSASKAGEPFDPSVLTQHSWTHVIALGNNAAKWLTKNDCTTFVKVDHPQYHKRFKSTEPYPLVELLTQLQDEGN